MPESWLQASLLKVMLNVQHLACMASALLLFVWRSRTSTLLSDAIRVDALAMMFAGDINEWQQCIQLNLLGPMALTHAFSPGMVQRKV